VELQAQNLFRSYLVIVIKLVARSLVPHDHPLEWNAELRENLDRLAVGHVDA